MPVPLPPSLPLPPSPSLSHISSLALLLSFFPLRFCRSRELSYSANEFGAAYLTGVEVFSIPFTNVTTYEGCRGCEGLEDMRATKVCNKCDAAHGKSARYVSFTIKMNFNGIHYTTAWRGKSATLYVLQYLDQSDMNDTLSVDDAIRQAFPKGQKLDIIVWYRTHISSEGIQCPVNVLHVVLSRPENHPSWPVHQLAVFNDTVAYSEMPELATPSQPAQVAMYVPRGLSAGGQVCGSNALLQVINATPLPQQFLLQLRNTGSPLRRALLKCLREMQGGAAPRPEHVRTSKGECGWNGNGIPSHSRKHKDIVGSMKLQCVLQPSLPLVPMLCTCHGHTIVVPMDFSCNPVQGNGNRWVRVPLVRDFQHVMTLLSFMQKGFIAFWPRTTIQPLRVTFHAFQGDGGRHGTPHMRIVCGLLSILQA